MGGLWSKPLHETSALRWLAEARDEAPKSLIGWRRTPAASGGNQVLRWGRFFAFAAIRAASMARLAQGRMASGESSASSGAVR
jgi:hypothetical protein